MNIENLLQEAIIGAIKILYNAEVDESQITLQKTKKSSKGIIPLSRFLFLRYQEKT